MRENWQAAVARPLQYWALIFLSELLVSSICQRSLAGQGSADLGVCNVNSPEVTSNEQQQPNVLLMTSAMPSDALPVDVMLPHQMQNLGGPPALVELLMDVDAHWPGGTMLDEIAIHQLKNAGVRFVCQNFTRRAHDTNDTLLQLIGNRRPKRISDFHQQSPKAPHLVSNTVGMLSFIERCVGASVAYCVWMDPDIFLHRGSDGSGWLDKSIQFFDQYPKAVGMMAPSPNHQSPSFDCHEITGYDAQISQRYFVLHRQRLKQYLPLQPHACAPSCPGFEYSVFFFPWKEKEIASSATEIAATSIVRPRKVHQQSFLALPPMLQGSADRFLRMPCAYAHEPWALHPPPDPNNLFPIFQACLKLGVHIEPEDAERSRHWPELREGLRKLLARIDAEGLLGPLNQDGQNMAEFGWSCVKQAPLQAQL
mmetsp:Transcript_99321/g.172423  ORF Transcript_99321/g.172423 Transcript_99321/m.172423 type:complete len:424 (-) Transcript_99321:52-1323(-)